MTAPTHADAMLFMEYYKLWDTPADGEAWTLFRSLRDEGTLDDFARFRARVSPDSHEYVLFDRVCCSFEQAGVLMKHGLMHPDLYFDAWASPTATWSHAKTVINGLRDEMAAPEIYTNFEWLARTGHAWSADRRADASSRRGKHP